MSVQGRITVIAVVSGSLLLAGCMGMNQMFMSEEQEAQYCDSYRSMLTNPNVTAQQRGQIIQGMNQMDCPNTPGQ
jgi:hypothetical protein